MNIRWKNLPTKKTPQIRLYEAAFRRGQKNQHVTMSKDGKWAVKSSGASKASKLFSRKADAVAYGKNKAKSNKTDLIIHSKDGMIKERRSYQK